MVGRHIVLAHFVMRQLARSNSSLNTIRPWTFRPDLAGPATQFVHGPIRPVSNWSAKQLVLGRKSKF